MTSQGALLVSNLLRSAVARLSQFQIEGPTRDARVLLAHCMEREPGDLIALGSELITEDKAEQFKTLVEDRCAGKPVYRIIGRREFFGRDFEINEACLEPRPETELLVERILADYGAKAGYRFCDIGTGSGAIAVTLLCEMPGASALATDIEPRALEAAQRNARRHGVCDQLETLQADCFAGVTGIFDFVVSNPPYIPTADLNELSREVREHDPNLALDGGADGMVVYRKLLDQACVHLRPGGLMYLETGHGQHEALCRIAVQLGWGIRDRLLDLSGLERIVVLER